MAQNNLKMSIFGQKHQVQYNGWDQIRLQDNGIASTHALGVPEVIPLTLLQEYGARNYWPLNETSGTIAYDSLGNMNMQQVAPTGSIRINENIPSHTATEYNDTTYYPRIPESFIGTPHADEAAAFGTGYHMNAGRGLETVGDWDICPATQDGFSFYWRAMGTNVEPGTQSGLMILYQAAIGSELGFGDFYVAETCGNSNCVHAVVNFRTESETISTWGSSRQMTGQWWYSDQWGWGIHNTWDHMVVFDWNDSGSGNDVIMKCYTARPRYGWAFYNDTYLKTPVTVYSHNTHTFEGITGGKMKIFDQGNEAGYKGFFKDVVLFDGPLTFAQFQNLVNDNSWRDGD